MAGLFELGVVEYRGEIGAVIRSPSMKLRPGPVMYDRPTIDFWFDDGKRVFNVDAEQFFRIVKAARILSESSLAVRHPLR